MKSFKQYYKIDENYDKVGVKGLKTQDLAVVYTWLKWGNAAKTGFTDKNPDWAKRRDVIGSELGKRARSGEEAAKRALNNRVSKNVDKYGKGVPVKTVSPKKTLLQKITKTIFGW